MIRLFLKAKHWQLFALILGFPLLHQCYIMSQIFAIQMQPAPFDEGEGFKQVLNEEFLQFGFFFPTVMVVFSLLLFGWF